VPEPGVRSNAAGLTQLPAAFSRERTGQLDLLTAHDFQEEGVQAFLEKRRPPFTDRAE